MRWLYYDQVPSPLGDLWMVACEEGLCLLRWGCDRRTLVGDEGGPLPPVGRFGFKTEWRFKRVVMHRWRELLFAYFSGRRVRFDAPIALPWGTPFQKAVWQGMMRIPYAHVQSYQALAIQVGKGAAARAVGSACGKNPLPIVIPCHRVIRHDGTMGGYTGGVSIKRQLLQLEGVTFHE